MRPSIHVVMLQIAKALAQRSTCIKLNVGCVLVGRDYKVLSAGYNGVPSHWPHCNDDDELNWTSSKRCTGACQATHAESNALISCHARRGDIYACYTTHSPCVNCCKQLIQTGCQEIRFIDESDEHREALEFWSKDDRMWYKHVI